MVSQATESPANDGQPRYQVSKIYRSTEIIPVNQIPSHFSRADLEFHGVDHSGASYEARVFINNPDADDKTPLTVESGYAGSFYIFGHGGCFGDAGHCEITKDRREFDPRPSHPLLPIKKVLIATDAIKKVVEQQKDIAITVVPIIISWTEKSPLEDVLKFDHIKLVTYS